jgi:methylated-DNA-protein-cysteine methyltransferase-like protein
VAGVLPFEERVLGVIRAIPPGDVMTYGEVAREAGSPGAARAVGGVMARCDDDVPWWRVVASNGRLVPGHERVHAERLRSEGIAVARGRVRMGRVSQGRGVRGRTSGR